MGPRGSPNSHWPTEWRPNFSASISFCNLFFGGDFLFQHEILLQVSLSSLTWQKQHWSCTSPSVTTGKGPKGKGLRCNSEKCIPNIETWKGKKKPNFLILNNCSCKTAISQKKREKLTIAKKNQFLRKPLLGDLQ